MRFRGFDLFTAGRIQVAYERRSGALTGITLGIRSGSRFDGDSPGIAHLAEHMLFQGTRSFDHLAINRRAAELGGEHDAYTGYEDLSLTFQVRNADVGEAIALLAEQALCSTVPADRLENERQVVAQEIRGHRDDAIGYLADETWGRFFSDGLSHPPSGTLASVRRITVSEVRGFLRRRLVAPNMILSVVGGSPAEEVKRTAAREFRTLPGGRRLAANGARTARTGEVRFRRSGLTQFYLNVLLAAPWAPRPLVALGMALEIVGADPDGRLYHEVRERRGLSYDLWADLHGGAGWSAVMIGAVAERRAEDRLRRAIEEVLGGAAAGGFGDEEVERARRKLRYRYARLSEGKLDRAASHASSVLYGAPTLEHAERLVETLSRAEIERAWRATWKAPRLVGVLTG